MYRAFLEFDRNGEIRLPKEEVHHLVRVRRAQPGARFLGFHPDGCWFLCELTRGQEGWSCLLVQEDEEDRESPLQVCLAQALLKKDKFEWVLQKSVELGVSSIVPLLTVRSEIRLSPDREAHKVARWNRILREAVKQSGRSRLPQLFEPMVLNLFLQTLKSDLNLVFDEAGGDPLKEVVRRHSFPGDCSILVGPEGGWDDSERELFRSHGVSPVHLGPRILRAETAPIAALSVLQYEFGDL